MISKETRPPITHVAVIFRDQIWSLPRPYRHHDILRVIMNLNPDIKYIDFLDDDHQGFLDENGRYLRRRSAYINALLHEQVKGGKLIGSVMTSEDLW